jgi:hypothetical protein
MLWPAGHLPRVASSCPAGLPSFGLGNGPLTVRHARA